MLSHQSFVKRCICTSCVSARKPLVHPHKSHCRLSGLSAPLIRPKPIYAGSQTTSCNSRSMVFREVSVCCPPLFHMILLGQNERQLMAVAIKGGSAIALCWELFGSICSIPWLNCDSISTEYNLQGLRVRLLLRALLLVPNSERNQDKDESHVVPCWQSNMMPWWQHSYA